jgi:glycosyltransferase involved in cell wall biosynthesis
MKILHLAMHEGSGAGRAAARLHTGLRKEGIASSMLVMQKSSTDLLVTQLGNPIGLLKRLQGKVMGRKLSQLFGDGLTFSVNATPSLIVGQIKNVHADVINLHWIGWEYLRIEDIAKLQVPLVWTLQDMWPFTGGCHYSEECDRYTKSCGACPQLKGDRESDLSRWVWQRKAKAWHDLNLTVVAPSQWMAECARSSSLFQNLRIEVIPFCLDTDQFQPIPPTEAREALGLPQDKQLVLFGALSATEDPRKGFQLLIPALQSLSESGWQDKVELVVFGSSSPDEPIDLGFKTHYLGSLNDNGLKQAYSAADVMIVPSLQESFGQTASEALACGTPLVAFNATGLKDIIDHETSGYLAQPYEIEDLARGIAWILEDAHRHQQLRLNARQRAVEQFSLKVQARQYISLYQELLEQKQ